MLLRAENCLYATSRKIKLPTRQLSLLIRFTFAETELKIHQPVLVQPTLTTKKQTTSGSDRNKIHNTTKKSKSPNPGHLEPNQFPMFENNIITNVTAQEGSIALLPCHVRNLGDRPVRTS